MFFNENQPFFMRTEKIKREKERYYSSVRRSATKGLSSESQQKKIFRFHTVEHRWNIAIKNNWILYKQQQQ